MKPTMMKPTPAKDQFWKKASSTCHVKLVAEGIVGFWNGERVSADILITDPAWQCVGIATANGNVMVGEVYADRVVVEILDAWNVRLEHLVIKTQILWTATDVAVGILGKKKAWTVRDGHAWCGVMDLGELAPCGVASEPRVIDRQSDGRHALYRITDGGHLGFDRYASDVKAVTLASSDAAMKEACSHVAYDQRIVVSGKTGEVMVGDVFKQESGVVLVIRDVNVNEPYLAVTRYGTPDGSTMNVSVDWLLQHRKLGWTVRDGHAWRGDVDLGELMPGPRVKVRAKVTCAIMDNGHLEDPRREDVVTTKPALATGQLWAYTEATPSYAANESRLVTSVLYAGRSVGTNASFDHGKSKQWDNVIMSDPAWSCVGLALADGRWMRAGETWEFQDVGMTTPARHVLGSVTAASDGAQPYFETSRGSFFFASVLKHPAELWRRVEPATGGEAFGVISAGNTTPAPTFVLPGPTSATTVLPGPARTAPWRGHTSDGADLVWREHAKKHPVFAEARRAALAAVFEDTKFFSMVNECLDWLVEYEDKRGAGKKPSAAAALHARATFGEVAMAAYERARGTPVEGLGVLVEERAARVVDAYGRPVEVHGAGDTAGTGFDLDAWTVP